MTDPHRPVRLILDRSALLAYTAGSMHVAEPVHEITHDGVMFGVPAVAAAEALAALTSGPDHATLRRLLKLDTCAVLDTCGEDWDELAYWRHVTGRIDTAAAVLSAFEHEATILSGEGKLYQGLAPVIDFREEQ